MSVLVKEVKSKIAEQVKLAAKKAMDAGELPEVDELPAFSIDVPADRAHGDYALNAAMVWSRTFKCAPIKIAQAVLKYADLNEAYVDKADIAGPGFINMFLSEKFYSNVVYDVINKGENYGRSDIGKGKKVIVEFVSANPTGPMHIGNARGGALGDCIASVYDFAG